MTKIKAEILPFPALNPEDVTNFRQWVWNSRHINLFDPVVMSAPRTVMCRASEVTQRGDEPLVYIPLQPVLMYDSIAAKPGLTPRQEALALARIGGQVDKAAKATGFQETYFICRDDRVSNLCKAHGFTEVENVRVLKKVVKIGSNNVN